MIGKGAIEELTFKETKSGSWFFKLKIDNRNYNCFEKDFNTQANVKAYEQLQAKEFKTGDVVEFEYSEHTTGETTYKNLLKITPLSEKEAQQVVQKTSENRDKTGTQIVRMNALTNAIGFFGLNKEVVAMNIKAGDSLSAGIDEAMVLKLAEKFETWVKR